MQPDPDLRSQSEAIQHQQNSASAQIRDRIKELRRVRAGDLRPNPKNWRRHPQAQAAALDGLLREIGYADALVPVLVLDVTEEEADKLLLTLDPLAAMAQSDASRIESLLQTVRTDDAAVRELLRRTAGAQLWRALHPEDEPPAQINKAGELQKKWRTKTGQLWRIGEHWLLSGDATEAEDVARLMADERAVLFATDPPYAVGYMGPCTRKAGAIRAPQME